MLLVMTGLAVAAPQQDFPNFSNLADVNPLVVQARPAAVAVERQGAAATNVPVVVPAPTPSEYQRAYCGTSS